MRETLLVVAAALIAFGWSTAGPFHFDDYALFSDPAVTSAQGWYEVWRPLQTRPLAYFTYWLNYQLNGVNAAGYHAVNLALHCGAAAMLLAVIRRLANARLAFVAALLFAVHPMQTEAVAYVFARPTLLCTLLCLVSWWLWLKDRPWAATLVFGAALLAKEECAAFPVMLLALWGTERRDRKQLAPIGVMVALAVAAGLRVIYAGSVIQGSGAGFAAGVTPGTYLSFQGVAILRYLAMLIVPWGYSVDIEIGASPALRVVAWLPIEIVFIVASWRWKKLRAEFWFIAGLILLAPSSSIFPAADLAADRRMYLPMTAFAMCAAWLLDRVPRIALVLLVVALAAISIRYSHVWNSEVSLWEETLAHAPGKVRPRIQLARAVEPGRALVLLHDAQRIAPGDPEVASEQGRVNLELGRPAEALAAFGRALALAPGDANAVNNRGAALQALGQSEAARLDFEQALKLNPCLFNARLNLKRLGASPPPANCRFTPEQEAQLQQP